MLIFPIKSTGGNPSRAPLHWTLLVFDVEARTWAFYNSWFNGKINDFNFMQDAEMVKEYVHKRRQELLGTEEMQKADDPFQLIVKEDCPQQKTFRKLINIFGI
ncbi:hypothetical protein OIU74_016096 [Salix koriyanagi]|uniref:Ubiquitin-like protease family profile domain-containing protein n=1 Tax=Salix koriyanagi TaxID=2511006 RepID=A0A9Q0PFM1_9ROSI|nr:hypothetical protein OIU74_016096 [Salix koriyanagi]